jgi:pimeloyl-ACP methyl ester carboxylesterase
VRRTRIDGEGVAWAAGAFVASLLIGVFVEPFRETIGLENVVILYLLVVVAAAGIGGRAAGMTAALSAALCYDYFLARLGHAASREAGRIPDAFIDWHVAMSRETDWARHERDMVRSVVGRRGYVPGFVLQDAEIARIEQPTLMVYGTADPVGSAGIWRRFVGLMPRGELEVVDAGGHLVWYDDSAGIGARVARFLAT